MEYREYLQGDNWKEKRTKKLTRKSNKKRRCAICASEENLDIHHLNYKDLFNVEQNDLRILCRNCHLLAHRLYKEGKFVFRNNNHHSRFAIIKVAVKKELGITKVNMFYESKERKNRVIQS